MGQLRQKPLLAPLELTIGACERIGADGEVVAELDEHQLRKDLKVLHALGEVEALTICFINAYINGVHERRAGEIAAEIFTDTPISISSDVVPEMQEYERTETTVVNFMCAQRWPITSVICKRHSTTKWGQIHSYPFCVLMVVWLQPEPQPSRQSIC